MTDNDFLSFGALLHRFRRRQPLTQQHLADAVGVHRNEIGRWELGDVLPASKAIVLELAKQLHLTDQETRQLLEASLTALSPYWLVPFPRNPFFTGREKILEALHSQLGDQQVVQSLALSGLGGVGKTQIALEYAYRHGLEYAAVFWISAETEELVVASLLHIAEVLQLPGHDDQNQQRVVKVVQRWLSTHGQWLLLWDNVEDLALLERFLPPVRLGAILITTRRHTLGTFAQGLDLVPMEQEEALLFLLRRAKVLPAEAGHEQLQQWAVARPAEDAAAKELVTVLGGLPLALDQAGAYLEATRCGLPAYLNLFQTHRAALLEQRGEGVRDHPTSVSTTFTLALTATVEQHPAVWDLLLVCAFLQPDAIPEELFLQGGEHLGPLLQAACADPLEWNRVVAAASSSSLLARQPEERTVSLHRLVQAVVLDSLTEEERRQWSQRTIEAVSATFPAEVTYATWWQCERLLPHALLCASRLVGEQKPTREALQLLSQTGAYLRERGQYAEAGPLLERALAICEQQVGAEHPDTAACLNNLAILKHGQGKYALAEPLYQRALAIREQQLGAEHPDTADSLNDLALLYQDQGKYALAEPLYQRALAIREQQVGAEHSDTADSLNNLATLYWNQGKYALAEPLYQRALAIVGAEHPGTSAYLNNLARLYQDQGKYTLAEPLHQRALAIREQRLGAEHPRTASSLNNLACLYQNQGKDVLAEPLHQRALAIREQQLGAEHPLTAESLNNLACLYHDQGKDAQAEPLHQRALAIREQQLGAEHPETAQSLDNLAFLYYERGNYEQAEPLYRRALAIQEQLLELDHPDLAISLNGLANLSREQGKDAEAEALFLRALSIREHRLDSHHPATGQTLHDFALLRQKQQNVSEARSLAERALQIRTQSLGDTHPHTLATQTLYTHLCWEQTSAQGGAGVARPADDTPDPQEGEPLAQQAWFPPREAIHGSPHEHDPLQGFLDACCERHPHAWCRSADLWQAYEQWVVEHQERFPLSRRTFAVHLKAQGFRADHTHEARIWRGITLVKGRAVTQYDATRREQRKAHVATDRSETAVS